MSTKKRVLDRMKEKKITRTQMAADVHIGLKSFTLWLEGRKELPYTTLWAIFNKLELDTGDLKRLW